VSEHPIRKLEVLHALLEQRLRDEQRKRAPNGFTLEALKRRKMQVKAAITRAG
jgi:hypothetical protein